MVGSKDQFFDHSRLGFSQHWSNFARNGIFGILKSWMVCYDSRSR